MQSTSLDLPLSLTEMPPFPRVALRALKALSAEDVPARALESLIRSDVVFASGVLHCANSALFGLTSRVLTLHHAIVVLGSDRLRCLILTTALRSFAKAPLRSKEFHAWWHHSLATALLSEALAKASVQNCPEAYMAGLLHDVGRLPFVLHLSRDGWRSFLRSAEAPSRAGKTILEVEAELFGIDHCAIGERLLVEWGMPNELIHAARLHHEPQSSAQTDSSLLVAAACKMASAAGFAAINYPCPESIDSLIPIMPAAARPMLATDPGRLRQAIDEKIHSLDTVR
jgi:HD-like signal output (HDOD) protein